MLLRVLQKHLWLLAVVLLALAETAIAAEGTAGSGFVTGVDTVFAYLVAALSQLLLFSIGGMPFIVLWLIIGAIFFSLVNLKSVVDLSDMMILSMAFPNLLGCYLLSGKLAATLENYTKRLQTGQMPAYK